ncbi:DUF3696 domain-containing protein [Acinetobacter soli]|uniref:DUF3696 domain-containing protein n=1 Tax=Acinetobacter soli TaxID=487316 RepID=UPI000F65AA94|nr:DUF3696 domain-containing protein [Acinetobacter soli]RSB53663.1 DUF3696 domain-containing protein [Acinetobacter soli]
MFTKLAIKNFKSISDFQELRLAPITLIYGPNSSGKSSLIQALLLLQQTMIKPNRNGGLVTNGVNIKIGNFPVIVNKHNINENIEIKLDYFLEKRNKKTLDKFDRSFEFSYGYFNSSDYNFSFLKNYKFSFDLSVNEKKKRIFNNFTSNLDILNINKLKKEDAINESLSFKYNCDYLFEDILKFKLDKAIIRKMLTFPIYKSTPNFSVPSSSEISFNLAPHSSIQIHPAQFETTSTINNIIVDVAADLKSKLECITYIGPLRKRIEKVYFVDNDFETSVGVDGSKIGYFLYMQEDTILKEINNYFKNYEIPYEILINKLVDDSTGPIISVLLKDLRTDTIVGPSDVGVGISQILPIIIEGIVRNKSTICVEQPEIHLHPKLQADLAEFFVDTCKNNQWIIETHSEALMLRLQKLLRMKDERIKPDDISIIYVNPTSNGSKLHHIRLNENGNFRDEWPAGFFDERIDEIFG